MDDVMHNKTRQRRFAFRFSTDGLAASVGGRRAKRDAERYRKGGYNVATELDDYGFDEEGNHHALDVREDDPVVGLDPGRIDIFAVVDGDEKGRVKGCSKKDYYQRAAFDHGRKHREKWHKNHPAIKQINGSMPTAKTASVVSFCRHLHHALKHMLTLIDFYGQRRWKRLRWKSHIAKEKAWDVLVKRITQNNPRTIVAFGNGQFALNSRGHASTPTKALGQRLRGKCRLRKIDEYRTSVTCSLCDGELPRKTTFWQVKTYV
ncbi:uncharacterized protein EV422DRAFT_567950 [Fimicolochytrium jonesii]|uniref:uncharacterized protein n=1 Tax=Fimicolochytrium jonesii TaxID=1396493 RepID=UPI0022FE32FE|nr:uncharacterized protein EV422DRAFT_567950 [Fimicolochytrium jonesii]KAI8820522.1 hypothetical protein EV422DRAFT_567950 [Fimicolochytrium jonesii]